MRHSIDTVVEQGFVQAVLHCHAAAGCTAVQYSGVLRACGGAPDGEGCCCGAGCALLDGQLRAAEGCRGSGEGRRRLSALLGRPGRRARGPHQPPAQCAAPMAPTWPGLHAAEGGGHGGLLLLGCGPVCAGAAPGAAGGCAVNHKASCRARWWRWRPQMRRACVGRLRWRRPASAP